MRRLRGDLRMKSQVAVVVAVAAALALSGCGDKGAPKGQVVAKIDKQEVTALDLQAEMAGFQAPNATARKAAEQQALNGIIQRRLLAEAAREAKIDKSPEFARQRARAEEALLVQTWQRQLTKAVPSPSLDEARQFISQHPDIYSARKIISIQGLRFAATNDPSLFQALRPLNTLEEVQALLTQRQIAFGNANGSVDALRVDPAFAEQLLKLPPNEVFVVPQGNVILVGHVVGTRVEPVADNLAVRHATEYLKAQRTRDSISRQFNSVIARGMKDVTYGKGFEAPKPSGNGAAPAPKAAPAAPAAKPAAAPASPG